MPPRSPTPDGLPPDSAPESAESSGASPGILQDFKGNLDSQLFFWIALFGGFGVFLLVPQIRNIWAQRPPFGAGFWILVGYAAFLFFLLTYYLLSLFVVMRQFPIQPVHNWVNRWVDRQMTAWGELGWRRFLRPWYWISLVTWRLPDLTSRWLVRWASHVDQPAPGAGLIAKLCGACPETVSRWLRLGSVVVALLIGTALIAGAAGDSSRSYPLAGVFCQETGLMGLLIGTWLVAQTYLRRRRGDTEPGNISVYQGRFLAWLLVSGLAGEALWLLGSSDWLGVVFSYRLYTIWAVAHLLTTAVILGLLVDRWHLETVWPIRQIALVLLPFAAWAFTRAAPVSAENVQRHLTAAQQGAWREVRDQGTKDAETVNRRRQWFEQFNRRIQSVPEGAGPVVIVAASGGGSRAAIFTALAFETLAHTPTDPTRPIFADPAPPPAVRTWADNIVLISSVSGGSLATAYFVERLGRRSKQQTIEDLRNTTREELGRRLGELVTRLLLQFPERQAQQADQGNEKLFPDHHAETMSAEQQLAYLRKRLEPLTDQRNRLREARKKLRTERDQLKADAKHPLGDADPRNNWDQKLQHIESEIEKHDGSIDVLNRFLAIAQSDVVINKLWQQGPNAPSDLVQRQRERFRWVGHSKAFDEMCLDFMAPIMRGILSPTLDRGDSLARFWTHRFGWYDCTNFNGYGGSLRERNYQDYHPLVVFNTCDGAKGSRLVVGFPALPADLWKEVYSEKRSSRERPKPLNEVDPNYWISLSQAVRMSSNFPFGFRPMELATHNQAVVPSAAPRPVYLLDGGVVDNTGLDTVYELFHALEFHAVGTPTHSPYESLAREVLDGLRKRGVVLLEIDAGAKPSESVSRGLLSGQTEPIQALNNAAYTNAEQIKDLYLKETRRILNQNLDTLTKGDRQKNASLAMLAANLPATTLHLRFECNHYQPGEQPQGPDVMTAWTLGPGDKAEVVLRFLIELSMWDMRRDDVDTDLRTGRRDFAVLSDKARDKLLLDQMAILIRVYAGLQDEIKRLSEPSPNQIRDLLRRMDERLEQYAKLKAEAAQSTDQEVKDSLRALQPIVDAAEKARQQLVSSKSPQEQRQRLLDLAKHSRESVDKSEQMIEQKRQMYNQSVLRQVPGRAGLGQQFDPQEKYDRSSKRSKEVFEGPMTRK